MDLRAPLQAALDRARAGLVRSGTWLTGEERAAVATEVRAAAHCRRCHQQQAALSPTAVPAPHPASTGLADDMVAIVHRLTRDSRRLRRVDVEGAMETLGAGEYVETLATAALAVILDRWCLGLGIEPFEPAPGEATPPDRSPPTGLAMRHNWVPTVDPARAEGTIAKLYASDASVATVVEALTLSPAGAIDFWRLVGPLYLKPDDPQPGHETAGTLTRTEVELLAARTSARNECYY